MVTINLQYAAFIFWAIALYYAGYGLYIGTSAAFSKRKDELLVTIAMIMVLVKFGVATTLMAIGLLIWMAFRH